MSEAAMVELLGWVGGLTGLAFPEGQLVHAEAGARRAMARAGAPSARAYLEGLERGAHALDDLVAELTVGESYFFREPAHFELIRREVLPWALASRGALRAWSAGCAGGEEPYSLAMAADQAGALDRVTVLGTDLSPAALTTARRAVYREWSLRGLDAAVRERYFRRVGEGWALDDRIRVRVSFGRLNLAVDPYPSAATGTLGLDLVLCRNVLIYLQPRVVALVARRLFDALVPGGWLVTGPSDPLLGEHAPFELVTTADGVFHRRPAELARHEPPPAPPRQAPPRTAADPFEAARAAFERGDYTGAAALAGRLQGSIRAAALRVRALANAGESGRAERACAAAAAAHPLDAELAHLHGAILAELGRDAEARSALERVVYLDGHLAAGHFALGAVLRRMGELAGARRAFERCRELLAARPRDEPVPLADGEPAGRLAQAAALQLELLEGAP